VATTGIEPGALSIPNL